MFRYINLDRSVDRNEKVKQELSFHPTYSSQFKRFDAIHGRPNNLLPEGHWGCSMSHYQILKEFLESTEDYCVILEDDIILTCDFGLTLSSLYDELQKTQWIICWLGYTLNCHNYGGRPQPIILEHSELFIECSFPLSSMGYMINRDGARSLYQTMNANFTYYDVEMIKVCEKLSVPKLLLKSPIVYENVWLDSSTTENTSMVKVHEEVNLNLYRRDIELNRLRGNNMLKDHFNTKHLFIGSHDHDYSKETILEIYNEGSKDNYEKLMSYNKENKVITKITNNSNIKDIGRTLHFLSFIPIKVYIENTNFPINKIPQYPNMKMIIGSPKLNSIHENTIQIRMGKYHFLSRWTFLPKYTNVTFIGHRCEDYIVDDYFICGTSNNKQKYLNDKIESLIKILTSMKNNKYIYSLLSSCFGEINNNIFLMTTYFNVAKELKQFDTAAMIEQRLLSLTGYKHNLVEFGNHDIKRTISFIDFTSDTYQKVSIIGLFFNEKNSIMVEPNCHPDIMFCGTDSGQHHMFLATKKVLLNIGVNNYGANNYDLVITGNKRTNMLPHEHYIPYLFWSPYNILDLKNIREINITEKKDIFCMNVNGGNTEEIITTLTSYKILESYDETKIKNVKFIFISEQHITEKILLAFMAGAIPIYQGPQDILDIFNPNCFIYVNKFKTLDEVMGEIKKIDLNKKRYDDMKKLDVWKNEKSSDPYYQFKKLIGEL